MCYKDAGYPVSALKFILNWFVTDKMVKNLHGDLFFDNVSSFLMKILLIPHFLILKLVILVKI